MASTNSNPSANSSVNPIPDGMHSITPHIVCAGAAQALAFYKKAFNATELSRIPGKDGKLMHASVQIGDSQLFLVDEFIEWGALSPKTLKGSPVTIHLSVDNVDAAVAHAVAAGAVVSMPVADMFWGARYGIVQDPFGHNWSIATQISNPSPQEIQDAMAKMG
jgi:PhnB protein